MDDLREWIKNFFYNRLIKKGYLVNNKDGNTLFYLYLIDVILFLLYLIFTYVNIWRLSPGVPTTVGLLTNFLVILRFGWGKFLKKNSEINNYFELQKHEIIQSDDVLIRVRTNQIFFHCCMAIVYAVGFVWFFTIVYIDNIAIDTMKGTKVLIKLILSISSLAAAYDNFQSMQEGIYLAVPAIYVRTNFDKEKNK